MTTAWRCAPCQRMRGIQITQWSGSRACNLLAKKSSLDAGGFAEESGIVLVPCLPLCGRSCGRYMSTRESGSIPQLSLQSKFLPSFRERYSPPNPESASTGRNLGWRYWTLGLKCDHRVWPWPWPWRRFFKVKYRICYISAKNGPIATKRKANISIEL